MTRVEKFIAYGTAIGLVVSAMTYLGLTMPRPVWADEFNEFKVETYTKQLKSYKSDLIDLEVRIWQAEQDKTSLPPSIKQKQLQLQDEIKDLESKLSKLEKSK